MRRKTITTAANTELAEAVCRGNAMRIQYQLRCGGKTCGHWHDDSVEAVQCLIGRPDQTDDWELVSSLGPATKVRDVIRGFFRSKGVLESEIESYIPADAPGSNAKREFMTEQDVPKNQ